MRKLMPMSALVFLVTTAAFLGRIKLELGFGFFGGK